MASVITLPISLALCYTYFLVPGSAADALLTIFLCLHGRARRRAVAVERAARSHRRRLVDEARGFDVQYSPYTSTSGLHEGGNSEHGSRSPSRTDRSVSDRGHSGGDGAASTSGGEDSTSAGAAERGQADPGIGQPSGRSRHGDAGPGAASPARAAGQAEQGGTAEHSPRIFGAHASNTWSFSSLSQGPPRARVSGLLGPPSRVSERPSGELLTPPPVATEAGGVEAGTAEGGAERGASERPLKRWSGGVDPLPPESSGELAPPGSDPCCSLSTGMLGDEKSQEPRPEAVSAGPGTPQLQVHTGSLNGAGTHASHSDGPTPTLGAERSPGRGQHSHRSYPHTSTDEGSDLRLEPAHSPVDADAEPLRPVQARYLPSGARRHPKQRVKDSVHGWLSGLATSVSIPASLTAAAAVGVVVLRLGGLVEVQEATDPWGERFQACIPTLPALVVVINTSRAALRCFGACWRSALPFQPPPSDVPHHPPQCWQRGSRLAPRCPKAGSRVAPRPPCLRWCCCRCRRGWSITSPPSPPSCTASP